MKSLSSLAVLVSFTGTLLLSQTARGYETVMVRNSGPAANRINIVVLGDGYLASELPQLEADVRTAFGAIDDEPFYEQYGDFFNVKLVLTSSTTNVLGNGAPGATLFGLYSGCQGIDRLICIGNNSQVVTVLNQDAPEWDLVAIIANSTMYAGSGGQFVTFTRDTNSTRILIHETAHQFATLADEYPDAYPAYPVCGTECPEPNATPIASPWASLKWNYWVNPATPLPTPDTAQYASVIGAFEGARYQSSGIFRPRQTCRMRAVNQTFCEICAEAHVLETYRIVGDFDTSSPSASQVSLSGAASLNLSVTHPQTSANSVHFAWSIDGSAVSSTTPSLEVPANSLSIGDHTVSVQLSDNTTFAGRDDPLLHKQRSWKISVTGTGGTSAIPTGGTSAIPTGGTSAIPTGGTSAIPTGGTSAIPTGGTSAILTGGTSAITTGGASAITTGGVSAMPAGGASAMPTGGASAMPNGGASAMPNGGASAMPNGGASAMPNGGASAMPNGGASAMPTGGASAMPNGGASAMPNGGSSGAMGGTSAATASTTVSATGGGESNVGGSGTTTGGTGGRATGSAGTTTSGAAQNATGGAAISVGGTVTSNTTNAGTSASPERTLESSCSCRIPYRSRNSTAVLGWSALLLSLLLRLPRRRTCRLIRR